MKIILASVITLFAFSSTFAQITPKSYTLGGSIDVGFNKMPGQLVELHTTSLSIAPGIGKFISDKYFIEGGVGYSLFARKYDEQSNIIHRTFVHTFSTSFGITRYFPVMDRLYLTFGGQITPAYATVINRTSNYGFTSSSKNDFFLTSVSLSPGLTFFIDKKWMLYASVSLLNYDLIYDFEQDLVGHNLFLSTRSNSFSIGARYVLGAGTND
jgi:hypothetical protein